MLVLTLQELKELREKEERERARLKNKQDAFAEIEKGDYTYDLSGKLLVVKKPNLQRLAQNAASDFQLGQTQQQTEPRKPVKQRLVSAKAPQQKELQVLKEARNEESVLIEVST